MSADLLMCSLFSMIDETSNNLRNDHILPNFQEGYVVRDSSGAELSSFNPGVIEGTGTIIDGAGNTVAHVREGVTGAVIDYGGGDTVHIGNSLNGGEIFQNSNSDILGYSNPGVMGEMNYQFSNGEAFSIKENPIGEGFIRDHEMTLPDFDTFSVLDTSIYDFADSVSFVDSLDMSTNITDGVAGLIDLLGIF